MRPDTGSVPYPAFVPADTRYSPNRRQDVGLSAPISEESTPLHIIYATKKRGLTDEQTSG